MEKIKPLTFLAPILEDRIDSLRVKLTHINDNLLQNKYLSFSKTPSIHFARLVIVDHHNNNDKHSYAAQLLLSTNFNGSLEDHVKELEESGDFEEILSYCIGFTKGDSVIKFIKKHSNYHAYFYASTWGRTSKQIIKEEENRKIIDQVIDLFRTRRMTPMNMFMGIKEEVLKSEKYTRIDSSGRLPTLLIPILLVISILTISSYLLIHFLGLNSFLKIIGIACICIVGLLAIFTFRLRSLEKKDPEYDKNMAPSSSTGEFVKNEDLEVQNQFTSIVEIKDGLFRKNLLKIVLWLVGFLSHYKFNKGKLGTIPTIHFARWVIVDKGKRLLFLSNFDGSWENYLGDFVDKAAVGLTAIWSNTKQFPKSRFLVFDGATDEERFKAVARLNQIKTDVWYSAYPHLSVVNKNRNTLISKGFNDKIKLKHLPMWIRDTLNIKNPPPINKQNMQGLLLDSYGRLPFAKYIFIEIKDVIKFKKWLQKTKFNSAEFRPEKFAINIAFSKNGLEKMDIAVDDQNGFSRPFIEGMDTPHRNRVLGDLHDNSPNKWAWGNKKDTKLHVLLLVYAKEKDVMDKIIADIFSNNSENGLSNHHTPIDGGFLKGGKEHFGFKDGISQPAMKGISSRIFANDVIEPGEFILGYPNQYGKHPSTPEPERLKENHGSFGNDGSYMVFRQLKQNVATFWENMLQLSETNSNDIIPAIALASKLVGRNPDGDPLVISSKKRNSSDSNNEFNYKELDPDGEKCPFGAHIRRTNPRDSLSLSQKKKDKDYAINIVKNHRILRKGRPYGPPVDEDMEIDKIISKITKGESIDATDRGLNFICFNTNIERQFEFIQHTWVNNPKFHDLYDEVDPLIGVQQQKTSECPFSVQQAPLRKRYTGLKQFVEVVGGSYFFFPSISAINQLGEPK
ncbi:Dyp-type peroxidase [Aquimarina sp. MMG016]|uniref:Dyp-type peroxidase n=1 Tax=Aquimarina sp. MMG016 TaxID=2822690 RepID=UPI001B3A4857|nr:Dyp-type peroxidase [Aquimarina sp. MMG016]MBQ4819855.1 Dyp-type peroxidase [Aquimarina sp. MMG016]